MRPPLLQAGGDGAMTRDEWSLVVEALGLREMLDGMDARHMIGGFLIAVIGWAVCAAFLITGTAL